MEIKFKITNHGNEYDIESTHVGFMFRKYCFYYGIDKNQLVEAIEDISNFVSKKFNANAIFYIE